jgi:hypothetical protein
MTRAGASIHTCTSASFKGVRNPNHRRSEERLAVINERMKEFRRKYPIR